LHFAFLFLYTKDKKKFSSLSSDRFIYHSDSHIRSRLNSENFFSYNMKISPSSTLRDQSGQIGIIILLIMVVLLTIGLSLAAQSSKEVTLSTQEEESTRVFNAAEAGIEQALSSNLSAQQDFTSTDTTIPGTNSNVNYTIQKQKSLEIRVPQGATAMVQLTDAAGVQTTNSINIEWAREGNCAANPASLVLGVFATDSTKTPKNSARYYSYAPCDYGDSVTLVNTSGGNGYFRKLTLNLQPKDVFVRIKPAYKDTTIRVTAAAGSLPTQAYTIRSSATNQNGDENRTVEVNRTLSIAPSVMDYVLFSGTTLIK
jgi:Tfp pilus assembly protein PilX